MGGGTYKCAESRLRLAATSPPVLCSVLLFQEKDNTKVGRKTHFVKVVFQKVYFRHFAQASKAELGFHQEYLCRMRIFFAYIQILSCFLTAFAL
jgi:hypothetical protein